MGVLPEFAAYMRRRSLADKTITRRLRGLTELEAFAGPLLDLTRQDVERFMATKAHLHDRSVYAWLSHLSRFYDWAEREELVARNPVRAVDRPKLPSSVPRPISDGDLKVALENADRTMCAWLHTAAFAGFRCSEVAGLQADAVLTGPGLIRAYGKGRKERLVPLHPTLLTALQGYGLPKRGWVFRRPSGGTYTAAAVSREVSLYFEGLGIPATLHMLRHWFASKLQAECGDLRVVQELMGHADISTTQIYTAFDQRRARRAVLSLDLGLAPRSLTLVD